MQPSKKLYNIFKLKKIAFKPCDGAMVARQIADLEAASSSLAHRSLDPAFFFLSLFLFLLSSLSFLFSLGTAILSMN
jgi:hypothetical protein